MLTAFYIIGGGEGDGKSATPLEIANLFDLYVAIKEI